MTIKKQILISLLSISSILTMNAQWTGTNPVVTNSNVGIGTSSPVSLLTLRNPSLADNGLTGSVDLTFATTSSGYGTKISTYKETFNTAGIAFFTQYGYTAPIKKMRISAIGNVSIGSSLTNSTLSIRNSQLSNDAATGSVDLSFYTNDSPIGIGTKISAYKETFNTAGIAFFTQYGYAAPIEKMRISASGNVGIGTVNPSCKLDVCGTIRANEVKVDLAGGCDFVFKSDYKLMYLNELDSFVKTYQHLPEIAPEKEMVENGVNMKDLQMKLLQKIEELTLYTIEQNNEIIELKKQNERLKAVEEKIAKIEEASK